MEAREREIEYYETPSGDAPFRDWQLRINDKKSSQQIDARVAGLRAGNFGKSRPVGEGVSESKIRFGPGFRIYYGVDGNVIVLLCGGSKSSQTGDIKQAKVFWRDYKARKERGVVT